MARKNTLFDVLLSNKLINKEQHTELVAMVTNTRCSESNALVMSGVMSETATASVLKQFYNMEVVVRIDKDKLDNNLINMFDQAGLETYKFIPYKMEGKELLALIVNPSSQLDVEEFIKKENPKVSRVSFFLILETTFFDWLKSTKLERDLNQVDDVLKDVKVAKSTLDENDTPYNLTSAEDTSKIGHLVNLIFIEAHTRGASDIHIEPLKDSVRVRYRIDGNLTDGKLYPKSTYRQIVNRIKVISQMNTNEYRKPQGGNLTLQYENTEFGLRISTLPTHLGEKITVRLLEDKDSGFSIDSLELSETVYKKLMNAVNKPSGIVLVVGATGSGKSTTLFTIMSHLNTPDKCLVTVEDPVEYKIEGTTQINVNNAIGLTFASAFREVLRQDPDIVMIGEIRDNETASIATQASMSGHLVFSTLHANDSTSAVARMATMGVKAEDLSTSLSAVISQTLVRQLCPHCKKAYEMNEANKFKEIVSEYEDRIVEVNEQIADKMIARVEKENKRARISGKPEAPVPDREELIKELNSKSNLENKTFYKAKGCKECNYTGYKGRLAIVEFLDITPRVREAIQRGATAREVRDIALSEGFIEMKFAGIEKAILGETSLEELHNQIHFDYIDVD